MLAFGQSPQGMVAPDLVQLGGIVVAALEIGLASAAVTRPLLVNAVQSGVGAPH